MRGASPNIIDSYGNNVLNCVLLNTSPGTAKQKLDLVRLLLHFPVDLDSTDSLGNTALHTHFSQCNPADERSLFIAYYLLEARDRMPSTVTPILSLNAAKNAEGRSVLEVLYVMSCG